VCLILALTFVWALSAQQAGSVNGLVADPSGAAVQGAKVTLERKGTGITRSTITGSDGLYSFSNADVGEYSLSAEAAGFKKAVANVRVEVAQTVRLDQPRNRRAQ